MGKRRFTQVSSSDDEEDDAKKEDEKRERRKRKALRDAGDDDDDEAGESNEGGGTVQRKNRGGSGRGSSGDQKHEVEEEEVEKESEGPEDAKPIGDVIKVSGKGKKRKNHYASFEYDGNVFELEDSVLLSPGENGVKPYVAIIKDITHDANGNMMVTGQWFYRPEEADKKGGGNWEMRDTRELFYSFHIDDVPAESVMHKCVVHFVPLHKQLPVRSKHPGFIVQKVYDFREKKLWKLTDTDYKDGMQQEVDLLVQKTRERLGDLPDIENVEGSALIDHQDEQTKNKLNLRRTTVQPQDVSRDDQTTKSDLSDKVDTLGNDVSEFHLILSKFKVLTGYPYRDKWLEKFLQTFQFVCNPKEDAGLMGKETGDEVFSNQNTNCIDGGVPLKDREIAVKNDERICWPDTVIPAITALEKVTYDSLGSDFQKYNKKMRQLDFNLKNNGLLARRLLNSELEPQVIVNMSPNELKDGITADEKASQEPEKPDQMQMTEATCSRCLEKKVGVADIIQAGGHGDRYQLECTSCGHQWYAARDAISSLADAPNVVGSVGTAPWVTAKFEDVTKKLASPRETHKASSTKSIFNKSAAACNPILETQKSFGSSK